MNIVPRPAFHDKWMARPTSAIPADIPTPAPTPGCQSPHAVACQAARLSSPGRPLHGPAATPAYVGRVILPAMDDRAGTSTHVAGKEFLSPVSIKGCGYHDPIDPANREKS